MSPRRCSWVCSLVSASLLVVLVATPAKVFGSQAPLTCDVPLSGTISPPFESDTLTFNVVDNEIVSFAMAVGGPSGPNFNPYWRLLRGDGVQIIGYTGFGLYD